MSLFDWLRPDPTTGRPAGAGASECRHCQTALPEAARFCFICGREIADGGSEQPRPGGSASGEFSELQARLAHTLDGRYRVRDVLGAGGMGVVFLADDVALDRAVAIKVLPPAVSHDPTVVERFRREAKTAARLDHPGIIPIYRVESEGGLDYFIMRYVAGRSLDAVLRAEGSLPVDAALRVLREAAAALAHAHRHGVVHRDVKPANIMLDADGRVVLTDFGISRASAPAGADATTEPRLTELGTAIGTPQYMAPEQAVGHAVDGRADQYALAIVGFEMLVGRVPFDEETPHAIIHRQISEAPPDLASLRPAVPRHVAATIAKGLRKSPSSRFATMEAFALALEDASAAMLSRTPTRTLGAGQGTPTRVLPVNEDRELDTALDRVFDTTAHRAPRSSRSITTWMTMTILVVALGALAWARGGAKARRIQERATQVATKPTQPAVKGATVVPQGRPNQTRRRSTTLRITSTPRATVSVDGKRIGTTPISNYTVTVGRTYRIQLERKGYRTVRGTVTVTGTGPVRRNYVLKKESRR